MIYLDTSVLAALYWPEPLSAAAEEILEKRGGFAISSLSEVEFFSALGRRVREGSINSTDAHRIAANFAAHLEAGAYERLPIESSHFRLAREWLASYAHPLRTLDALHLAVTSIGQMSLATADTALAKCGEALGAKIILVNAK